MVTRHLLRKAGLATDEGHGGAVTLIQRFGSAANLNIHVHCFVLDGVYRCAAEGAPAFIEVGSPTDDELHVLPQTVITPLMKLATRRGVLIEEMGQTYLAEPDDDCQEARTLRPLQTAAVTYRIGFGRRPGQKMLALRGAMPRKATGRQALRVDIDALGLHAAAGCQTTASGWSNCAATSPGRLWPTSGCSSTRQDRWSSSSRHRGATAPRTWS